jgi:hypothetical protein
MPSPNRARRRQAEDQQRQENFRFSLLDRPMQNELTRWVTKPHWSDAPFRPEPRAWTHSPSLGRNGRQSLD